MKIVVVVVCIYWRFIKAILENFEFFFLKKQPYDLGCGASNRRHRVKHHVGFLVLTDMVMIFTTSVV